jgi:hypothetical protein
LRSFCAEVCGSKAVKEERTVEFRLSADQAYRKLPE